MTPLELAALIAAVLAVLWAVALAVRSRRKFRAANDVVPGVKSPAPSSWAGSHSPEARLHRRLRDAVAAVRAAAPAGGDTAMTAPFRDSLEREALALDERLVAVAALPERVRGEPLEQLEGAVEALEDAAAVLTTSMGSGPQGLPRTVADMSERLRLLGEARIEVDQAYSEEITHLMSAPEGTTDQTP